MSDTPETPRDQADRKRSGRDVGEKIDALRGPVERTAEDVDAVGKTVVVVAEMVREVQNDMVLVKTKVAATQDMTREAHQATWRHLVPPVTLFLVVFALLGLTVVFASLPAPKAVANEVAVALKGDQGPAVTPKDIADIKQKLDALHTWATKSGLATRADLKAELAEVRNELLAKSGPGAGLDKKVDALEKALTGLRNDLPVQVRDQLIPLRDALAKNAPDTKGIDQKLTQLTADVKGALAEQGKRLDALEARLSAALRLPKDDNLVPVLFVLECGGRMLDLHHEAARAALLRALEESVRLTPGRSFGLLLARGKDAARQLRLNKHDPAEVAELVARQEPLVPIAANEVAWERACGPAIDDVLLRPEPRKRVVYVTCSPPTETKFDAGKLAAQAAPKRVEVWVIHLLRSGGDGPSRDLATLATETGGAYLVVPSPRDESPRQKQAARRLEAALFDALDLRAPDTANK